ncbi:MAG: Rrf2 family transcriptional regulator [candidate division WOR-3 bacterium]
MFITRKTDYAIRSILYLCEKKDKIADVNEISRKKLIPKIFLAKILQKLSKKGIVKSLKGRKGGFYLVKDPSKLNLMEIIELIQGPISINLCAVDKRKCKLSNICSVHPVWVEMRKDIEKELRKISFKKLIEKEKELKRRKSWLK